MDSHPHMVISHEVDLFTKISSGFVAPTKPEIFNEVWRNSKNTVRKGERTNSKKGYTLLVDGLYQGEYVDHIDVIGDKKGGTTTRMLCYQPDEWLSVYNTLKTLNVTLKVVHVIRNPYDNIATLSLYGLKIGPEKFRILKQSNQTDKLNLVYSNARIENWIDRYFFYRQCITNAKKIYNLDMVEIHNRDLISDPRGTLMKMCNALGVTCSNKYMEICSNKVYKSESKTRHMIKWTNEQLQLIQQNIKKYSNLKGYSFDSL